jgi:nucleoside-diphosphate-sugar epimerase
LASGKETTIADLANLIVDKTNSSSIVNLGEKRSWDNSGMRFGDPTKARLELGFECTVSLSDGIEQTVNWTIDNQARISTHISSHDYFMEA